MFKCFSVIGFVFIGFAVEAAAQVYVPPPVSLPPPVNSSHILAQREIGRTAAKRRKPVRRRKSVTPSKSHTAGRKVSVIEKLHQDFFKAWLSSSVKRWANAYSARVETIPNLSSSQRRALFVTDVSGPPLSDSYSRHRSPAEPGV